MEIIYQPKAIDDLKFRKRWGQKQIQEKILTLLQSIQKSPFEGIGKPEALKHIGRVCGPAALIMNIG